MSNDLMRFSVAMPEELLMRFDQLVARRGLAKNRSEVVRDLVRDALVEDECATPGVEVMGTLTIVFDHHASDVQEKLHNIQHDYFGNIVSTLHVHLDQHHCLDRARAVHREPDPGHEGREERATGPHHRGRRIVKGLSRRALRSFREGHCEGFSRRVSSRTLQRVPARSSHKGKDARSAQVGGLFGRSLGASSCSRYSLLGKYGQPSLRHSAFLA